MALPSGHRLIGYTLAFIFVTLSSAHAAVDNVTNIVISSSSSSGSDVIQMAEVIAIEANSGVDLANSGLGASISSTGIYNNNSRYSADNAIDGNTAAGNDALSNYYHSLAAPDQSLTITFPNPVSLVQLRLVGRTDCCSNRDVYDVILTNAAGDVVAQQNNINANNNLHTGTWDIGPASPPDLQAQGRWGAVMDWPLVAVSMANLPDGRILTYSGSERRTWPRTEQTYSATWDPLTGQFDETLHLGHNMFCASMSMTEDGQVFVNGGRNQGNSPWTSLYNYQDNQWTQIENMASGGRWYPTTLALGNGDIFTAMGNSTNVRNPEVWSGADGWQVLNGIDFLSMRTRRNERGRENVFPLLSQAPNGDIFHFWDTIENHYISVEGNGEARQTNADTDHGDHSGGVQVMYDIGKLLVSGANDGSWGGNSSDITDAAFTVDLNGAVPQLNDSAPMNWRRKFHSMIPLPTGEVLIVGGNTTGSKFQDNGSVFNAEIWNPDTREFRIVAPLSVPRDYHSTALLMVDGRIITAGGGYHPSDPSSGGTHQDAQLYSPGYLFTGNGTEANRPTVSANRTTVEHGASFNVTTSGDIDYFSLIKMSATTHAINTDARFFKPTFNAAGTDSYSITMHANPNVATPGYWMLFAVDSNGVPSIAEVIQVLGSSDDGNSGGTVSVEPIVSTPTQIGDVADFDVNASGNNLSYSWNFGDNTGDSPFSSSSAISHQFNQPGYYVVTVTIRDADGNLTTETFIQVVHNPLTATMPVQSGAIIELSSQNQLWSVNPDNNSVTVINTNTLSKIGEIAVGNNPRALAQAPNGDVWVVNKSSASVTVINAATLSVRNTYSLDPHSLPHGLVFAGNSAYVALQGLSSVVQLNSANGTERRRSFAGEHPRHLALNAAGNLLYVSNFITAPIPGESGQNPQVNGNGATVQRFTTNDNTLNLDTTIVLGHSNRAISEHSGPGMPNYLGPVAISPDGINGWVPSKQDNITGGTRRGANALSFDQSVRAISSHIDLQAGSEILTQRVDHDNASVASHAAFDPFGLTLFVALEGNRQIAMVDVNTATERSRFDTGFAPQSVMVSNDGSRLYVHNFTDRSIGVYNIADVVTQGSTDVTPLAVLPTVASESLTDRVLRGKRLFYDARDDRLAALDYMSCASCHNEGGEDGRVWDFTALGEGLRNTISLNGAAGMGNGLLHWSANFDELQDFEGQIRDFAGGSGLMSNSDFQTGSRSEPLGDSKAGISADLDALAAYLSSLDESLPSPHRTNGTLSVDAQTGLTLFSEKGCAQCHSGANFTDSSTLQNLHNVGTLDQDSGNRLGGSLAGLDSPTLLNTWNTPPYLHDGSAGTIRDAILAHNTQTLSASEASALAEFVLQLDASDAVDTPPPPADSQSAYRGITALIPGLIEAEHYDEGGQGIAYNDNDTNNRGSTTFRADEGVDVREGSETTFVGWTVGGEWLEYTINATAGTYNVDLRFASPSGGQSVILTLNGAQISQFNLPATGGFASYQNLTLPNVSIPGGDNQILRVELDGGLLNIDWLNFTPATDDPDTDPDTPPADSVESAQCSSIPSTFTQAGTLSFPVVYAANEARDISVELWKGSTYLTRDIVRVDAGTGTATAQLTFDPVPAVGNDYLVKADIRPVGTTWRSAIDQCNKPDVVIQSSSTDPQPDPPADCNIPWTSPDQSITRRTLDWTSAPIDISCASSGVNISMSIEGRTPQLMEDADYLNIYYAIDGGAQIPISENTDGFARKNITATNVQGNNLVLTIQGKTSWNDETYEINNILVSQ